VEAIIQLAERLGKAIADSPQAASLRTAREELDKHEDLSKTLSEFQEQSEKMARLEQENDPVEVEDKRRLRELQDKLVASETFKRFTASQLEYVDLMRKVNEALRGQLVDTEGD